LIYLSSAKVLRSQADSAQLHGLVAILIMGFLGIREDNKLPHIPGTVLLNEDVAHSADITSGLKHGSGKDTHIILAPQPSEDPNDPLNWSSAKKVVIVLVIGLGIILNAATVGPLLNAGLFVISTDFGVPIGHITLISGYQLLVAGASGPIVSACSRKWGKRPCFIFSSLFALVGTIVGSATNNYNGLLAARIIQGASISAYESLVIAIIGDIYFVHQRGTFTSAMQFLLGAISNFSSVITGPVVANLGWKYLFHILIAFVGLQTILLFLFCPETAYIRDHRYDIDELANEDLGKLAATEKRHEERLGSVKNLENTDLEPVPTVGSNAAPIPLPKTFWQQTVIFTGTYSDENLLQLVMAPFAVCTNIAVFWVVVVSGTITATYVAQAYVLAQIFSLPPYNLNASGIGYLSLGPFIGGVIACVILGFVLDPLIRWASNRNGGVYEPEYRLLVNSGGLLVGTGLMLFGFLAEEKKSYYATATVHGIVLFGVICVTVSTSAYALDAFRDMSNEIFIAAMVFKNFLFYGFSYFVNDWTARVGPAEVFYVFGGVAFALIVTTPIVFIWGKQYRSFWHRHNLLEKFNIRTHADI
jgi:MFS family permease